MEHRDKRGQRLHLYTNPLSLFFLSVEKSLLRADHVNVLPPNYQTLLWAGSKLKSKLEPKP
jgi:hypothetical protein